MKKFFYITLCFLLLSTGSSFGKIYLVELGTPGSASWRTPAATDTLVNLSVANNGSAVTLNQWFHDKKLTNPVFSNIKFIAGDQIWLAAGTYAITSADTISNGTSVYGGFAGTETDITQRVKNSSAAWDFKNASIIDGGNTAVCMITTSGVANVIDGVTLANGNQTSTTVGQIGGAGQLKGTNSIMRNCIVRNCSFTGSQFGGASGMVILASGATISNCYFHDNSASGTASTASGALNVCANNVTVSGCKFENNTSVRAGAAIYLYTNNTSGTKIQNCYFNGNTCTGSGTDGGAIGCYMNNTTNTNPITILNCTFENNSAARQGGAASLGFSGTPATGATQKFNIIGCTFDSNISNATAATGAGGALSTGQGAFLIDQCKFNSNSATNNACGGAIYANAATDTISRCVFSVNTCGGGNGPGGAIYSNAKVYINNCLMYNNIGTNALQVNTQLSGVTANVNNCTFASNITAGGTPSGIYLQSAALASSFTNCLFFQSGTSPISYVSGSVAPNVTYCGFDAANLPTYAATANCIKTISSGSFIDTGNNDYHLAAGSTAIDAGTTIDMCTSDLDGVSRPRGLGYDMGAYEYNNYTGLNDVSVGKEVIVDKSGRLSSLYDGKMRIYSISGVLLQTVSVTANQEIKLPKGLHVLTLTTQNEIITQKVSL